MSSDEETFVQLSCSDSELSIHSDESDSDVKSNEGGIKPYNFEPYLSDTDHTSDDDMHEDQQEIQMDIERLQNTEWCKCHNCVSMPLVEESVCCCEIDQVSEKKGELPCIIGHPGFLSVCLDAWVLQTAYYAYRQQYGHQANDQESLNKRYRYVAYRQLARWCWGYLGKEVRVPLPSCAVNRIREEFPSPDYEGFHEAKVLPSLD